MMNGLLLCHEAAELLLPQGFDDPRAALGMLALEAEPQQRAAQVRGRGGETDAALGCDEEMEEDMMAVDGAQQLGVPTRWRGPQHQQYLAVTMAEVGVLSKKYCVFFVHFNFSFVRHGHIFSILSDIHDHTPATLLHAQPSAIRAPHPAAPTGSGALTRPPMDPQATRAPLPMPPPPRALGRSQSLPAYHTSVNYHGGGVNGLGARQPHHTHHQYEPPHPRPQPQLAAAALLPPPPPPPFLLRQRSFSCLSRPYRSTTGRFLSENLARVEEVRGVACVHACMHAVSACLPACLPASNVSLTQSNPTQPNPAIASGGPARGRGGARGDDARAGAGLLRPVPRLLPPPRDGPLARAVAPGRRALVQ